MKRTEKSGACHRCALPGKYVNGIMLTPGTSLNIICPEQRAKLYDIASKGIDIDSSNWYEENLILEFLHVKGFKIPKRYYSTSTSTCDHEADNSSVPIARPVPVLNCIEFDPQTDIVYDPMHGLANLGKFLLQLIFNYGFFF